MSEVKEYPAYRFHPTGKMALIYTELDNEALASCGWMASPPEGFRCPQAADYHDINEIPNELLDMRKPPYLAQLEIPLEEPKPINNATPVFKSLNVKKVANKKGV